LVEETKEDFNDFKKIWEKEKSNFERISVFVGDNETNINFSWYSTDEEDPYIKIGKKSDLSDGKSTKGTSETQFERDIDYYGYTYINEELKIGGKRYYTKKVTIKNIERNTTYYYQRYIHGSWENKIYTYKTYDDKDFKFIFVGDPQIGGSHGRYRRYPDFKYVTTNDEGNCNDAYNWNFVLEKAFDFVKEPSVLLTAGDQADETSDYTSPDYPAQLVNTESQYSAFLYPDYMKQIVTATCVGNHEIGSNSFARHFNTPNSFTNSGTVNNFNGWYPGHSYFFKYNNVLVVVLETNYGSEDDYRRILRNAIFKYPNTDWRIALFHHDIFGNGSTHSQSDSRSRRGEIFNVLSKYKFDLVINGHDHVYTASKIVSYELKNYVLNYNSPDNYKPIDIKDKSNIRNPQGIFFVTANCSTGAKYLDLMDDPNIDYVNYYKQSLSQSFGVLHFTETDNEVQLSITTYETKEYNIIDGSYVIKKDKGSNNKVF